MWDSFTVQKYINEVFLTSVLFRNEYFARGNKWWSDSSLNFHIESKIYLPERVCILDDFHTGLVFGNSLKNNYNVNLMKQGRKHSYKRNTKIRQCDKRTSTILVSGKKQHI